MAELNLNKFSGANNIRSNFYSKSGVIEPKIILNADLNPDGSIVKRLGLDLVISLAGAHSSWAGKSCALTSANNILYRIHNNTLIQICNIDGPVAPLSYVEVDDLVYISNLYWNTLFNSADNSVSSWGLSAPTGPMLLTTDGSLPAGTYHVCMTLVNSYGMSGNSPISTITLNDTGGIQVINKPDNSIVWITDTDEPIFYLAGSVSKIVSISKIEPLLSFLCSPPPFMENLCYAFGRIWGSVGPNLYYSQSFNLGWFKLSTNIYPFEDEITLIAKAPTGLFIGMKNKTQFLAGTNPEQMKLMDAGAGSIKGTLAYCNNMPELGWTLGTPEKDFTDVPVWLTTEGIVVGGANGHLFNISKNKIRTSIPEQGASLYRNLSGTIQFLTNFKSGTYGSKIGDLDEDTLTVFRLNKLDLHSKTLQGLGSRTGFTDTASCTVTRNGEII